MGLAFDAWDLDYYTSLFQQDMKRDPTNVELFDIAQSNSEHSRCRTSSPWTALRFLARSRHWYFKGKAVVDGTHMPQTLMQMVQAPLKAYPNNSVISFEDNSSALRGGTVHPLLPLRAGQCSPLTVQEQDWDILLTAETHNFPCAVAPCPG